MTRKRHEVPRTIQRNGKRATGRTNESSVQIFFFYLSFVWDNIGFIILNCILWDRINERNNFIDRGHRSDGNRSVKDTNYAFLEDSVGLKIDIILLLKILYFRSCTLYTVQCMRWSGKWHDLFITLLLSRSFRSFLQFMNGHVDFRHIPELFRWFIRL